MLRGAERIWSPSGSEWNSDSKSEAVPNGEGVASGAQHLIFKSCDKTGSVLNMKKSFLFCSLSLLLVPACMSGKIIKDVDFPATPVDMSKVTKMGKACFSMSVGTSGNGSIIEAAKNGGINKVYMVEYSEEFEVGGFVRKKCTYVYGE